MVMLLLIKMMNSSHSHGVLDHKSLSHSLQIRMLSWHHHWAPLVSLPSSQEGSIIKHILSLGIQGPEVSFTRIARLSWHFDETVIETKIMSNGVLPLRKPLPVVWKPFLDKFTNAIECQPSVGSLDYCHGYESNVGVWRFIITIITQVLLHIITVIVSKVIIHLNLDIVTNSCHDALYAVCEELILSKIVVTYL